MKEFNIQRISLFGEGYCGTGFVETIVAACGITDYKQNQMLKYISDIGWGIEPQEIVSMLSERIPATHLVAKENWDFDEVKDLLCKGRVGMGLDVTDILYRVDKVTGSPVPPDKIDGHYILLEDIVNINGTDYVVVIDSSKDEIVQPQKGVIITEWENIYLVSESLFKQMWYDVNKDGSINKCWGVAVLHPEDDPSILEEFRK